MPEVQAATSGAALNVVVRLVRPLHRHLVHASDEILAGTGLTPPMRGVLERLYEAGPQTVPQIARRLGLPRQFVQRSVGALATAGHVLPGDNPAHRRSPLLALTPAGRSAIEDVLAREAEVLSGVAARLGAADVEAAIRVLERLVDVFAQLSEKPTAISGSGPDARRRPPTG